MKELNAPNELETPKGFGETIRRIRNERRMSIYALAEKSGLTANYICSIEHGRRDVSFTTIQAIAKGFGIPMRDLFGAPEGLPADVVEALRLFENAPQEWREAIWDLLCYEPKRERKECDSA